MKPRASHQDNRQGDMFRTELADIIDLHHALVLLAGRIDWAFFEREFSAPFSETTGAPAKPVRLMVGLHYLKHVHNLSDEVTVAQWVENPYWQYFCGMKYFEHAPPIDPSSMTRWRKMIGEKGAEALLAQTIAAGLETGAIRPSSFAKLNVDTTVQEKAVAFPTDARLYDKMRRKLVRLAEGAEIKLRQSYDRVGRKAVMMVGRFAHSRKMKEMRAQTRKLKTILGRVVRDIERKVGTRRELFATFLEPMLRARELLRQRRDSKKKIYSIHAPEVECIGKGKAHKRYEFGCKVSVVATSREGFVIGMRALHGSPYDGHTLAGVMEQAQRLAGRELDGDVFTDLGYRKHNYDGSARVHVGNRAKEPNAALRKWKKRRAAIEPLIGHMKNDGRLGRNHLLGQLGDQINAIMSACGQNLRLMLGLLARSGGGKGRRKAFAHLLALVMWALGEVLRLAAELRRPELMPLGRRIA